MATTERNDRLRDEVERILTARYPVTFTSLSKTLNENEHNHVLDSFAENNPCKVTGLVHAVNEQLTFRASTIDLLQQLSYSSHFSKCFVELFPDTSATILDRVLRDYDTYRTLGIHLATAWNGASTPLPNACEELFITAVRAFGQDESDSTLWDLYRLSRVLTTSPKSLLSQDSCQHLLSQLIRLAKSKQAMSSTVSIALLHKLRAEKTEVDNEANAFFAGENPAKIIRWMLLQVALIPRPLGTETQFESGPILEVIDDFLSATDGESMSAWLCGEGSVPVIAKLCRLCSDSRHPSLVRWRIADILQRQILSRGSMKGVDLPVDELLADVAEGNYSMPGQARRPDVVALLSVRSPTQETTSSLLSSILKTASDSQQELGDVAILSRAREFVKDYRSIAAQNTTLRMQVLNWLLGVDREDLSLSLRTSEHLEDCRRHENCSRTFIHCRHGLQVEIARLIVTSAALDTHETRKLEPELILQSCEALQQLSTTTYKECTAWRRARRGSEVLPKASIMCTPATRGLSSTWVEDVQAMVRAESRMREESIVHFVQQVCEDLEERCQNAEEPWRQEQEARQRIEADFANILQHQSGLQQELSRSQALLAGVRSDKARLESALDGRDSLISELREELEALRTDAHETSRTHAADIGNQQTLVSELRRQLETSKGLFKEQEDGHLVALEAARAANVDLEITTGAELAEAHATIQTQRQELQDLRDIHDRLEVNLASLQQELENARVDLRDKSRIIQGLERASAEQSAVISAAQEEKGDLLRTSESAHEDNLKARGTIEKLTAALNDAHLDHKTALDRLVHEYDERLAHAESRASDLDERHLEETHNLERVHQEALTRADAQLQVLQLRHQVQVDKLQDRITHQETHLAQKRRDLAAASQRNESMQAVLTEKEAQLESLLLSMKHSMMQALGTRQKPELKTPRKSRLTHKEPYQSPHANASAPLTPAVELFEDQDASISCTIPRALGEDQQDETLDEPLSTNSSFASGPTPKRQKPHQRPFRVPTIKPPRLARKAEVLIVASPVHRQALQDISKARGNRSPVKSGRRQSLRFSAKKLSQQATIHKKMAPDPVEEDFGDDDFGSELLTSTQFSPSKSAFRISGAGSNDDTTLDV